MGLSEGGGGGGRERAGGEGTYVSLFNITQIARLKKKDAEYTITVLVQCAKKVLCCSHD